MSRKTAAFADDDYDDGFDDDDDDDYYGDYDEYDDTVAGPGGGAKGAKGGGGGAKGQQQQQQQQRGGKAVAAHARPHAPAAAAANTTHVASVHAPRDAAAYPLAPGGRPPGAFAFNTPSPDERARAAGPAGRPTVGVALAPSRTPTVKQQQQAAQARKQQQQQQAGAGGAGASAAALHSQHSIDGALHELDELHLGPPPPPLPGGAEGDDGELAGGGMDGGGGGSSSHHGGGGSGGARRGPPWRPLAEYVMEADLAKDVKAAEAAEAAAAAASAPNGAPNGGPNARPLALVVMGHVDAGKSTLMGRLLHDLGAVSQKEVHKNQRESAAAGKASFSWAWVLDERPEERARGVTVDVAVAHFSTPRRRVTLLDAPGHRDFVPNMISGAAQADAALLLVDGSPGGFEAGFYGEGGAGGAAAAAAAAAAAGGFVIPGAEPPGGQTQEHAQLARSLGVEQLAVVVSKLDTAGYSRERFEHIRGVLGPFLRGVGFKESAVAWLPAVGPLGLNLTAPPAEEPRLAAWWSGPTLVDAIDAFEPKPRLTGAPLRLPVHDAYRGRGAGAACVGGKLEGGALRPGARVVVVPGYEAGTVKALEANGQHHAPLALAGDAADVQLAGIELSSLRAGAVLCHPDFPVRLAVKFTLQALVLPLPLPLLKGHAVTVHAHTAREAGVVSALLGVLDARTGAPLPGKHRPRCLTSGQTALVEVTPVRPLPLELFKDLRALGRVALREGGRTVMVGVVVGLEC